MPQKWGHRQPDPGYLEFLKSEAPYYVLNENAIFAQKTEQNYYKKVERLMKLRNLSTSPPFFSVKDHERFNIFAKHFQKGGNG